MADAPNTQNASIPAKSADPAVDTNRAAPSVQSVEAVQQAEAKAFEAQVKAAEASKSPEQRSADQARAAADEARRKAAADDAAANALPDRMTVVEAKIMAPVPDDMGAGDHMAQKFRNDPDNPHIYKGDHADPEKATERLRLIAPDHPSGFVTTVVHPEMVGDYLRAGWDRY